MRKAFLHYGYQYDYDFDWTSKEVQVSHSKKELELKFSPKVYKQKKTKFPVSNLRQTSSKQKFDDWQHLSSGQALQKPKRYPSVGKREKIEHKHIGALVRSIPVLPPVYGRSMERPSSNEQKKFDLAINFEEYDFHLISEKHKEFQEMRPQSTMFKINDKKLSLNPSKLDLTVLPYLSPSGRDQNDSSRSGLKKFKTRGLKN